LWSASSPHPFADAFWRGLHALGYSEGQNIKVEFRYTDARSDRAEEYAEELVRLGLGFARRFARKGREVADRLRRVGERERRSAGRLRASWRGGRWCFGKTPMQTFLDAMPMTKEKMIAA
jgi:hypothetical protein